MICHFSAARAPSAVARIGVLANSAYVREGERGRRTCRARRGDDHRRARDTVDVPAVGAVEHTDAEADLAFDERRAVGAADFIARIAAVGHRVFGARIDLTG